MDLYFFDQYLDPSEEFDFYSEQEDEDLDAEENSLDFYDLNDSRTFLD
ncbi:MAG: hypothetical protein MI975_26620 [Cytophagales bacterium]|nr:hypothetical protein [Cytophagales bacterium]